MHFSNNYFPQAEEETSHCKRWALAWVTSYTSGSLWCQEQHNYFHCQKGGQRLRTTGLNRLENRREKYLRRHQTGKDNTKSSRFVQKEKKKKRCQSLSRTLRESFLYCDGSG